MTRQSARAVVVCLLVGLCACGGGGTTSTGTVTFPSPNLMQLRGQYRLGPGEERYQCFITRWSRAGGLRIAKARQTLGPGVHHLGVFTDEVGVEQMGTRECADMGIWGFVYGAGPGNTGFEFPAGTALDVTDGTPIILQLHLLNARPTALDVDVKVEFDLLPDGVPAQPVGSWITGTTTLRLPAGRRTDIYTTCRTHPKMENVFAVYPHMHRLGASLGIEHGSNPMAMSPLFELASWDFGDQGTSFLSPAARIDENVPIRTRCSYNNTKDQDVSFGLSTNDEMCAVLFYYWPAVGKRASYQLCDE